MSLVIASTTDTQAQVNEAAGITTPQPSEAPATGEPEAPQEPEPAEPDPDQDTEEQDDPEDSHKQTKRKWGAQERISRLTREKYQLAGRVQELERRLMEPPASRPQERPSPPQPQQPTGEPQESQYERYEDYVRAVSRWEAAQAYREYRQQDEARRAQETHSRQQSAWQGRVADFRATTPDFDSVMADVEGIELSPVLQQAILEHEDGARLAYELAKDSKTLERISRLSPTAAVRELGKFEARILNGTQAKPPAVSKAPPPISPVGQGSTKSTKSVDDMTYQEYKLHWQKTHPGKRP